MTPGAPATRLAPGFEDLPVRDYLALLEAAAALAGDPLFGIDPTPFRLALNEKQAKKAEAEADTAPAGCFGRSRPKSAMSWDIEVSEERTFA